MKKFRWNSEPKRSKFVLPQTEADRTITSAVEPQLHSGRNEKKKLIFCAQKLSANIPGTMSLPRVGDNSFILCCSSKTQQAAPAFDLRHELDPGLQW